MYTAVVYLDVNNYFCRLERDHEDALQHQKDALTKSLNAEMLRALKAKDSEMRQELTQAHAREETLKSQVRDAVRASCGARSQKQASDNSIIEIQKLQHEVSTLRTQNKQLEERLQVLPNLSNVNSNSVFLCVKFLHYM